MSFVSCPKCGFRREGGGPECRRCGLIFDRYKPGGSGTAYDGNLAQPSLSPLRRALRVFRWLSLVCTILVLLLVLCQTAPPHVTTSPEARSRAEMKVQEFQSAAARGQQAALQMDEAELNSWVKSNLSGRSEMPATEERRVDEGSERPVSPEARSNVRDVRLQLAGDHLKAYVLFDFHGKELSLMLEGRLEVREGCVRLTPEAGKLGSLPLPRSTLESAAHNLFDSPENREKFRLPPEIRDVRVENNELVVSSR